MAKLSGLSVFPLYHRCLQYFRELHGTLETKMQVQGITNYNVIYILPVIYTCTDESSFARGFTKYSHKFNKTAQTWGS